MSNKVCSVIPFSNHLSYRHQPTQVICPVSLQHRLDDTSEKITILFTLKKYKRKGESGFAKTFQTNPHHKRQQLESVNSCHKKLSSCCSSSISITVVNEKYSNANEKKYKAHV